MQMTYGTFGARSILSSASELLDAYAGLVFAGLQDGSGIARLRQIKKGTGVLVSPEREPISVDLLCFWRDRQVAAVLDL